MRELSPVYYIIFTAVTAAAVLLQAVVLLALFLVLKKAIGKLLAVTDEVKEQALPLLATTRGLVEDISPKLKVASSNLVEVSHTLRHQANHVSDSVNELCWKRRMRRSAAWMGWSLGTLDAVDHATRDD